MGFIGDKGNIILVFWVGSGPMSNSFDNLCVYLLRIVFIIFKSKRKTLDCPQGQT